MNNARILTLVLGVPVFALAIVACDQKSTPSTKDGDGHVHKDGDGHDHKDADGHDHKEGDDHAHKDGHDHGPKTDLGVQVISGMTITAAREGDLTPGGEAIFDITVSGGAKPAAVRAWIGTQDAKGAIKGKAEAEGEGWHAHAEVPKPLPAGSKLWVEVETATGEKHAVGFTLTP